ncbi:diacylglycerol kinase [Polaribacter sp. BM10]|uniref:diacylglycerol/lipid kinase family protein n=1 Tax=Polaribacter sp. BM10 TaxID=1529069 RepID=UPI00098B520A|nr:diacylglycerol kinase family protein [Polaribacter sp. BM10]AQS94529.1 diacylglycerol kinase [Polaribacter sp. BM10]
MSTIDKINTDSWFIIANPASGNKNFSKIWKKIEQLLNNKNLDYSFAFTQFSKHEIDLVQNAIKKGYRNIISVGGDGTLHNVVNGVMLQRYVKTSNITIGVLPLGTGNDWIKTYKQPNSIEKALEIISKKTTILQDIGVITTDKHTIYYNNVAGIGYDGYIVNKLKYLKKFGALSYLLAGIYGLIFYKKSAYKILINNKELKEKCLMVVCGICKYSGGGMQFTKDVNTTDGLLDITIAKNLNFLDLIINLPKLYSGAIVNHKKVNTYKTSKITVMPINAKPFIQADGELITSGKLQISIIPKAINFVIN